MELKIIVPDEFIENLVERTVKKAMLAAEDKAEEEPRVVKVNPTLAEMKQYAKDTAERIGDSAKVKHEIGRFSMPAGKGMDKVLEMSYIILQEALDDLTATKKTKTEKKGEPKETKAVVSPITFAQMKNAAANTAKLINNAVKVREVIGQFSSPTGSKLQDVLPTDFAPLLIALDSLTEEL